MTQRTVNCSKLGKEAPGLTAPPFSGELGDEIFEKVSAQVWQEWQNDLMIKIINEYRLDLTDEKQYNVLIEQMKAFLGLNQEKTVLEVENAARGRGES
ncbi:MAG: oxidative damage protection protein [Proteobacteria bacterium]|nr:oxidative damage protection protein [Pseudomonadota bacterium]